MLWYGKYGLVLSIWRGPSGWYGMLTHDTTLYGMVWNGMVWYGVVVNGMNVNGMAPFVQ